MFHTVRKAAAELGVGYSTVKQWIRQGRVRTTQTPGGHHRISDAEIARLVNSGRTSTAPPRQGGVVGVDEVPLETLSARNRLSGIVEEIRIDGLLAQVRLRVGNEPLTAVITADAVRALRLKKGEGALAVIKSTEVMIARPSLAPDLPPAPTRVSRPRRRRRTRRANR